MIKIIYSDEALNYNKNENFAEGSYRLDGVEKFAERISNQDYLDEKSILDSVFKIHTKTHWETIKNYCDSSDSLAEVSLNPESIISILSSVGLAILASEKNFFALTRPPGHHAEKESAKGFCFLNNIAIATQNLLDKGKKVCIIDFDGHPGDGTQTIFYNDKRVLFCSIHQENSYPFVKGHINEIGGGDAKGLNINLPLPINSGDDILLESFCFLEKYIEKFKPDVIGISAGFDGYYKDNLLDLNYTQKGYYLLGNEIKKLKIPVFAVLEGGYHSDVLKCVNCLVRGLNNQDYHGENKDMSISSEYNLQRLNKIFSEIRSLLSK